MRQFFSAHLFCLLLLSIICRGQTTYEVNYGTGRMGVDVIYSAALDSASRVLLLSRNVASVYPDHTTSLVSFNSLAYAFKSGVGITNNAFITNTGASVCVGLQYILNHKSAYIYAYLTREISERKFYDNFLFIAWQPSLTSRWNLLLQNELNTSLQDGKNALTLERFKVGLSNKRKVQAGIMVELVSHQETLRIDYKNVGLFIKMAY